MLKKICFWFLCLGISYLTQLVGLCSQEKSFMYIYLAIDIIYVSLSFLIILLNRVDSSNENEIIESSYSLKEILFAFITSWLASKMFNVNFYICYEIMTFGQCWYISRSTDN